MTVKISLVTHTRDRADHLPRLLATTEWVDERVIVDMASTDDTVRIAQEAGCRVVDVDPAPRVDGVRNAALREARHEWVLTLDSDEYLSDDAPDEIARLVADHGADHDGFSIPRFNYIAGQVIRSSGWYPDRQLRLFRNGCVRWSDGTHIPPRLLKGDERLMVLEPPGCLHIHHANYADLRDVIRRQLAYALDDLYADDPEAFDFQDSIDEAYEAFAMRFDPALDGELSKALATVMAWDRIVRGLIQWDRLGRQQDLGDVWSMPASTIAARDLGPAYRAYLRARFRRAVRIALERSGLRRRRLG